MIKLSELPECINRIGRIRNRIAVITCGYRTVTGKECVECGGIKNASIRLIRM